jgi:hypothetical protein
MKLIANVPLFQYGLPVYKYGEFECTEKDGKRLLKLGVAKETKPAKKAKANKKA